MSKIFIFHVYFIAIEEAETCRDQEHDGINNTMHRMHGEKEEPRHTSVVVKGRREVTRSNTCYRQGTYFGEVKTAINIICYRHKILRLKGIK